MAPSGLLGIPHSTELQKEKEQSQTNNILFSDLAMADTLTLKEVELDYEADEVEDVRGDDGTDGTPREEDGTPREEDGEVSKEETDSLDLKALDSSLSKEDNGCLDGVTPSPEKVSYPLSGNCKSMYGYLVEPLIVL